jgi:hypothetical protein
MRDALRTGHVGDLRCLVVILAVGSSKLLAAENQHVSTRMQNVHFHLGKGVELRVASLSGRLVGSAPGKVPTFDDLSSYVLEIDSARVSMTPESLTNLLNNIVFADPGAPIKNLKIEVEGSELKQSGVLKKGVDVPFTMRARLDVTPEGKIRMHPTSMKAAGFISKRVLNFFGVELEALLKLKANSPVQVDGDDLLLDPEQLLPPPRIRGRLTRAWISDGVVVQQFGGEKPSKAITLPARFRNYMYYRGGTLRFGKLTMTDTDLMLVDEDSKDPFDFSPGRYNEQLMAGYSKNTRNRGLITHMPDLNDLPRHQLAGK